VEPVPGGEEEFYDLVSKGLKTVESAARDIAQSTNSSTTSKMTLKRLHQRIPEPFWGANAPNTLP
jgi:hypothetical protein